MNQEKHNWDGLDDMELKNSLNIVTTNRNFRNLWFGLTVSYFGDAFYQLAIAWYVFSQTGSGLQVGLILVATFLPDVIIGPFLGVIVDRYNRKRIMQTAQSIQALAIGILALSIAFGFFELWLLYMITIIQAIASAIFRPAQNAWVPQLVDKERLITANSFFASSRQITNLFGALLGGPIVALVGASYAIGFNAVTFFVALIFIQLINDPSHDDAEYLTRDLAVPKGMWPELREGFQWLANNRTLLWMLLLATVANMALGPINVLLPMLIQEVYHASATAFGIFDASLGFGILIGSSVVGILRPKRAGILFGISLAVQGLGMLLIAIAPNLPIVFIGGFILGLAMIAGILPISTALQLLIPSFLRGRVSSINNMISGFAIPLSYGFVGLFGDLFGPKPSFMLSFTLFIFCMGLTFLIPSLRNFNSGESIAQKSKSTG